MSTAALNAFIDAIFKEPRLSAIVEEGGERDWLTWMITEGAARQLAFSPSEIVTRIDPSAPDVVGRLELSLTGSELCLSWTQPGGEVTSVTLTPHASFDHIFGAPNAPGQVERPSIRLNTREAMVAISALSIVREGEPVMEELDVIERLLDELHVSEVERTPLLSWLGRYLTDAPGELFQAARAAIGLNQLEEAFTCAAQVALADNVVTPEEYNYLHALAGALDIDEGRIDGLVQEALSRHISWKEVLNNSGPKPTPPAATTSSPRTAVAIGSAPDEAILTLARHLEANHWRFELAEDGRSLSANYRGEVHSWRCIAQMHDEGTVMSFQSLCPFNASVERRRDAAEFIARVNQGLSLSSFTLRFLDGEVSCRTSICVRYQEASRALLRRVVSDNVETMETYLDALASVIDGADPAEAFAMVGVG